MAGVAIPWRGPGPDRPRLPLPPDPMPLWRDGQLRKRWRYVGLFAEELMLCVARAEVGPLQQSFWVLWDREGRRHLAHTALRPGSREVRMEGRLVEIDADGLRATLRLGEAAAVESICPSPGDGGWGWTRKRAGLPIEASVALPGGRSWELRAAGVEDESAGYHQRHTSWRWSAGVGRAADGRDLAWNLVAGVNDPERGSERGVWIDGEPCEPAPVAFDGTAAIEFRDGSRLAFAAESEHARDDDYLLLRSRYRHRFGTFSGALDGLELSSGLGVMEEHDALW